MIERYRLYGFKKTIHHTVVFLSFVASNTAPTIADNSKSDDTSNGNKNSLNNTLPRFFTKPRFGSLNNTGCETPTAFKAAITTTIKQPPPKTAAIFTIFDFTGSESLFRLMSIRVYRNNTSIAPM